MLLSITVPLINLLILTDSKHVHCPTSVLDLHSTRRLVGGVFVLIGHLFPRFN
jgi:hypothetical protein